MDDARRMRDEIDQEVERVQVALEKEKDEFLRQIRAEQAVHMRAIFRKAWTDMERGLARAAEQYRGSLARIERLREAHRADQGAYPVTAGRMEALYDRMALSSRKDFESSVAFIKKIYKKGFGIG